MGETIEVRGESQELVMTEAVIISGPRKGDIVTLPLAEWRPDEQDWRQFSQALGDVVVAVGDLLDSHRAFTEELAAAADALALKEVPHAV